MYKSAPFGALFLLLVLSLHFLGGGRITGISKNNFYIMNPQKDVLKVVVLIAVIAVAGFFIWKSNSDRGLGQSGRAYNVATPKSIATCVAGVYIMNNAGSYEPYANGSSIPDGTHCVIELSSCNAYAGRWDAGNNSCITGVKGEGGSQNQK